MLELPQITPEQFWLAILGLIVFGAWQFVRLSSKAEAIQQEAQRLINKEFAKQQTRIDEQQKRLDNSQSRHDILWKNYTSLNLRYQQAEEKIKKLEDALEEQQRCNRAVDNELVSTRKELAESEKAREKMELAVAQMQATIKTQEERIVELEAQLKAQGVQMELITEMLADSEKARKVAEDERDQAKRDYETLMADMDKRIEAAVTAKVIELQSIITEKNAYIATLEAKLEEVLAANQAKKAKKGDI